MTHWQVRIIPDLLPFGESLAATVKGKHKRVLYEKQDGICYYCGIALELAKWYDGEAATTLDHIIPRGKGGANHLDNKVLACGRCNNAKADTWPYQPYYDAQKLWAAGTPPCNSLNVMGAGWQLSQLKAASAALGDDDMKQELNDLPVGTTFVKTKRGWSASICNTHTDFERVSVKAATIEEALLGIKDAYAKHKAAAIV